MIRTTEGIVLRTLPFGESSLIVTLYTQQEGMKDFIVKGVRTARGKAKHSLFQHLSMLHIVYYDKPGRELQLLTESSFAHFTPSLTSHPVKMVYGMLVGEVFYNAVRETEPDAALYNLLKDTLLALDGEARHLYERTVFFLLQLTGLLGFMPQLQPDLLPSSPLQFDLEEGLIHASNGYKDVLAPLLYQLSNSKATTLQEIAIPQAQRKPLLALLLRYYQLHLSYFKLPRCLDVFEEVFA